MKAERHRHVVAVPVEQVEFKFPEAAFAFKKARILSKQL